MKHPKSYDSTPETRKRMSKVKLKGGKAETLLAKALWHQGYRYRKNDKRLPAPQISRFLNTTSQYLLMVSFGTEKTGKPEKADSSVIVNIGSIR